ncbi:unnamed protein product [Rotaria sp. Silwood2]|nr:unnamed protein product [Rotaria sp. Silwood2]
MSSTGRCFDIGAATSQSLQEFERRQQQFAIKYNIPFDQLDFLSDPHLLADFNVDCSEDGAAGNGALMRLAPVPLFFHKHPAYAVEYSGISGIITHGDLKAYDACRYYGALIVAALRGETKEQLLDDNFYFKHETWFNNKKLVPEIMNIAQGSYKRNGGYDEGIRGKGYVVNALEAALWAFWCDDGFFKTGALNAVNLGDDTDTTAAIYGQLAGAYYGYTNLPKKWVKHVYAHNFIMCLSKWILYEGQMWQSKSYTQNTSQLNFKPNSNVLTAVQSTAARGLAPNTKREYIQKPNAPLHQLTSNASRLPPNTKYPSVLYDAHGAALAAQSDASLRPTITAVPLGRYDPTRIGYTYTGAIHETKNYSDNRLRNPTNRSQV